MHRPMVHIVSQIRAKKKMDAPPGQSEHCDVFKETNAYYGFIGESEYGLLTLSVFCATIDKFDGNLRRKILHANKNKLSKIG